MERFQMLREIYSIGPCSNNPVANFGQIDPMIPKLKTLEAKKHNEGKVRKGE